MKARAVRLHAANDLRLDTFELPEIRDDEILVKVKKAHNVPDHFELVSTISMGYSNSKLKPATRRPPMIFSK